MAEEKEAPKLRKLSTEIIEKSKVDKEMILKVRNLEDEKKDMELKVQTVQE
jgi:hypothetical protein